MRQLICVAAMAVGLSSVALAQFPGMPFGVPRGPQFNNNYNNNNNSNDNNNQNQNQNGNNTSNNAAPQTEDDVIRTVTARYGGELPSVDASRYVRKLAAKLPNPKNRTFEVHLVDSSEINHFSVPTDSGGAHIFITRGLLEHLDDEAQLAAVLSLEMAHTNTGHFDSRIAAAQEKADEQKKARIMGAIFNRGGGVNVGAIISASQSQVKPDGSYGAQFTADEEMEATKEALKYMDQANYDPREFYLYLDTVLKGLSDPRLKNDNTTNIVFTHSLTYDRAGQVKDYIDDQYRTPKDSWTVGTDVYAKNVKNVLPPPAAADRGTPDQTATPRSSYGAPSAAEAQQPAPGYDGPAR